MNDLLRKVDAMLSMFGKLLVGVLALGVIVSVLLRYIFSIAFVWSEELLTMVFVATTFFGAALGLREQEHIAISYFVDKTKKKTQKMCFVITHIIIIIVSGFVFFYSIKLIQKVGSVPSPATGIARGVYYAIIPISFIITIFYALVGIIGQFIPVIEPMKGYKDDADVLNQTQLEV